MIIYRPHRGSLVDSIAEAKEFNNEQEMKEYIVKQWNNCFTTNDIVIGTKEMNDDRIGWKNVKYVCIKKIAETLYDVPQCIGMCATEYVNIQV